MELAWLSKFYVKSKSQFKGLIPPLQSRKPYILPTRFGLFFSLVCLILLYTSFATGNNLMYLYTFLLVSMGVTSLWLTHINIKDIYIDKIEVEDAFADSDIYAQVHISNRCAKDRYAIYLNFAGNKVEALSSLAPWKSLIVSAPLGKYPRGEHPTPRLSVGTTFPFGLLKSWKIFTSNNSRFIVYPARVGQTALPLLKSEIDDGETQGGPTVKSSDAEFAGHRKFETSDSARQIDWKAYARTERLLVKDYQSFQPKEIHLHWDLTETIADFEMRLSQMAFWVDQAETQGFQYSFSMGPNKFSADRGRRHFLQCMRVLALADKKDFQ